MDTIAEPDVMFADTELIFVAEQETDGTYIARALDHSIFTEADTLAGLREMIREAVQLYFDNDRRERSVRLYLVPDEVLTV